MVFHSRLRLAYLVPYQYFNFLALPVLHKSQDFFLMDDLGQSTGINLPPEVVAAAGG
jgi:hypothetical protein